METATVPGCWKWRGEKGINIYCARPEQLWACTRFLMLAHQVPDVTELAF